MEHPLALAVYNDGGNYRSMLRKHAALTPSLFIAHIRSRIERQARLEQRLFGTPFPNPGELQNITMELVGQMERHAAELATLKERGNV